MKANKHIDRMFTKSGCLRLEGIKLYILDQLDDKVKEIVKDHIDSCDFCKDAIEGIQSVENIKTFEKSVKRINSNVGILLKEHAAYERNAIVKRYRYISVAASIALLIGVLFILNTKKTLQDLSHNMISEKDINFVSGEYEIIRPTSPRIPKLDTDNIESLPFYGDILDEKENKATRPSLLLIEDLENNIKEIISYEAFRNIDYSAFSTESMSGKNKIIQIVLSRQGKLKEINIITDTNHSRKKVLATVISSPKKLLGINKKELLRKTYSFPVRVIRQ